MFQRGTHTGASLYSDFGGSASVYRALLSARPRLGAPKQGVAGRAIAVAVVVAAADADADGAAGELPGGVEGISERERTRYERYSEPEPEPERGRKCDVRGQGRGRQRRFRG